MSRGNVVRKIHIEKLGQLQTWTLRDQPYKGAPKSRAAYEAGFVKRTQEWNQGVTLNQPPLYRRAIDADAWQRGYDDALMQDSPNG